MAGSSVTETHERRGAIGVLTFTVTADDADGTVPNTALTAKIGGRLLALETNPGATAPTALYDITITDGDGLDVLEGVGGNRSAAASEKVAIVFSGTEMHPPVATSDALTFKVANNSVNSAVLTAKLYYKGADA